MLGLTFVIFVQALLAPGSMKHAWVVYVVGLAVSKLIVFYFLTKDYCAGKPRDRGCV